MGARLYGPPRQPPLTPASLRLACDPGSQDPGVSPQLFVHVHSLAQPWPHARDGTLPRSGKLKVGWKREHLLDAYYLHPSKGFIFSKSILAPSRKGLLLISLALIHGWVSLRKVHSSGLRLAQGWRGTGYQVLLTLFAGKFHSD